MTIVDAHLDLSYNAISGRDVLRPAAEQAAGGKLIPTVGLPDLAAGGVSLVCATVFTEPSLDGKPGYRTADEAYEQGRRHLAWYQEQEAAGVFRLIRSRGELTHQSRGVSPRRPEVKRSGQTQVIGPARPGSDRTPQDAILLMEGADPLRTPADVADWFAAGLRIVGLAWKRTRYAGGTGDPGPLTPAGVGLVPELDRFGIIHDTSHLAEESFWQLLDLTAGPVMASHSNCRAIVPTDRQLSDDMIRAIAKRNGVIGVNFFDRFLIPPDQYGTRRARLADVVAHVKHIADVTGDARHAALGTDMDGGLGRNEIPVEIITSADLPKVAGALSDGGFGDDEIAGVMGQNWLVFFGRNLPQ